MKEFIGQTILIPPSTDIGAVNHADMVLVKIVNSQEMTTHAGYFITFKPISGDYNKIFKDVIGLDGVDGLCGRVGYSYVARLGEWGIKKFQEVE